MKSLAGLYGSLVNMCSLKSSAAFSACMIV
ncbi:Uncharacterised protein [Mycobacterium tuberculosis]|nr:Uncharacterised protein [Mycobacterium tuberculosis]